MAQRNSVIVMASQQWNALEQNERILAQNVAHALHLSPIVNVRKKRFIGQEFVTYVVKLGFCDTRSEASQVGGHLLIGSLIQPTREGNSFSDDSSTYELVGFDEKSRSVGAVHSNPKLIISGYGYAGDLNQRMFLMLMDAPMRLLAYKSDMSTIAKRILDIGRVGNTMRFSSSVIEAASGATPSSKRKKRKDNSNSEAMQLMLNVDERGLPTSASLRLLFDNIETSSAWASKLADAGAVNTPTDVSVKPSTVAIGSQGEDEDQESFYSYTAEDIHGKTVAMSDFRNKVILVLNVASQ
eukprot:m.830836 g.830836  ORF g.830836 m.830836 type:complete len:297 (-) comp23426_c0_seq2:3061-3951(-)